MEVTSHQPRFYWFLSHSNQQLIHLGLFQFLTMISFPFACVFLIAFFRNESIYDVVLYRQETLDLRVLIYQFFMSVHILTMVRVEKAI